MYIFFALILSFLVYVALVHAGRPANPGRVALGSLAVLVVALVFFNYTSRAVGVDLGPLRPVSYAIPQDYLAKGLQGALALVPYAIACLAPALAFATLRRRHAAQE